MIIRSAENQVSACLRAALVIIIGLAAAQVVASLHVHSSNLALHDKMQALRDAGYLIVPGSQILPRLMEWKQAVLGGLFFTLTLGVFLTLLSLAAAWLRHFVLPGKKAVLFIFLVPWLASLLALNIREFTAVTTLYFLVIPPLVYSAASRWLFKKSPDRLRGLTLLHALPPLLLGLIWSTQMDGSFFTDVRDYLLLSNPAGTKINDFYYRYTLYSAEAFKSLSQKSMKTVFLKDIRSKALEHSFERELLKHDYLVVAEKKNADLVIMGRDHEFHLQKGAATVCRTNIHDFLTSPGPLLADFSARTDADRYLRRITFVSLLIGFPMFFYLLAYWILLLLLSPLLSPRMSSFSAAMLCLLVGTVLFSLFFICRGAIREEDQAFRTLDSASSIMRVAALKFIENKGLEITRYPAYRKMMNSPLLSERSALVKALAKSNRSISFKNLLVFLDDPHSTVVSEAFQALGKRRDPAAIPHILRRIETSTHWYNQLNAYKALRSLGWKQSRPR